MIARYALPARDLDDLINYAVLVVGSLDLEPEDMMMLSDAMKTFAGEYARLLIDGKVSEDLEYKLI